MDPLDTFANEARTFTDWLLHGTSTGNQAMREAAQRLASLYQIALALPSPHAARNVRNTPRDPTHNDRYQELYALCRRFPLDYFSVVFNPLTVPGEAPMIGSLADALADIYLDLIAGLQAYDAADRDTALWEWSFNFQVHWGRHATEAIYAIHCWLAENNAFH